MSSIFLGIVGLQKDLSLLTTKRLYSKSVVVNDRKFRDRVEEVDQIQGLSTEFKIDLLFHEGDGTFTVLESIIEANEFKKQSRVNSFQEAIILSSSIEDVAKG